MEFLTVYATAGLVIWGLVTALWLLSVALRDTSIIDPFWGTGFVVTAWVYFLATPHEASIRPWLITILVTVWGLRLSLYLLYRNWGKGEDFRYQEFRREGGESWWWVSYFKVFILQGVLVWIISIPLLTANYFSIGTPTLSFFDYIGVLVWAVGFYFEAAGDLQLTLFKRNPENKGKLLTTGVWRYTRHPNYFGDAAQWWGYYLIALAVGGWWTVYSPILMTFFLIRVSGVALLEKSLANKKPGYKEYIEATNAFIPWFPRKKNTL
jgi:steroid 5-alpha reductase family enzyme